MTTRITSFAALLSGSLLALLSMPAQAGYAVLALAPLHEAHDSFGERINAQGASLGEAYVRQNCPVSQWMNCLMDGYVPRQPRAAWWSAAGGQPILLQCLSNRISMSTSWDMPCEVEGMNARGVMVGRSYAPKGAFEVQTRPVLWLSPDDSPVDLSAQLQGLPAYTAARAVGINDQGWVLGRAQSASAQASDYAFLLRDGLASVLPAAGALSVKAKAINATMAVGDGQYDRGGQSGVILWTLGGATHTLRTVDGAENYVYAQALSTAGHVAGFYWAPASKQGNRAYVWFQGRAQALPTDTGYSSVAYGVNAAGQVAGSHCRTDQDIHGCRAVVWTNGVRQDLNTLAMPPAGFTFVQAKAINDQGQITGWMVNGSKVYRGFVLKPDR
ncbi:MAG TPA: hypothetical protein VFW93_01345 [Aquabacterium sp.]|uniref:hypothetical protein n=1 Tax=Aquabacterium sp. TaxID=1872578 RepID=UPI002E2ECDC5|nr:hypothetical protein [Aquabacterium sp.]HEX5354832.1 hypothetical protein [Aquabacterium sp.]